MTFFEVFLIALGLSMDCFAVSVSYGTSRKLLWNDLFRVGLFFGFFQGLMTFVGWWFGDSLKQFIESVDHWIAFSILSIIGIRMIIESFKHEKRKRSTDIRKFRILISLSIATSIDALMTGVSFGFIKVDIIKATILISFVTFFVTIIGGKLGEKTTFISARRAELIGGIVLIFIGAKLLFEHLGLI
jgi:manganese efflux pump family protein